MQEGTKLNMNKHFAVIMRKEDSANSSDPESAASTKYTMLKRKIFHMFARKVLKNIKKIEVQLASQA